MIRKDELERKVVEVEFPDAETTFHYKFTSLISGTMRRIRPFFTEQVYVNGRENLRENSDPDAPAIKGSLLFIIGHESWWDFIDLPPEWSTLPRKPMVKVVARDDYAHFLPLDYLINKFFSPFTVTIKRTWNMEGLSEEEKEKIRQENNDKLGSLFNPENIKYDRVIPSESSTRKNGAFNKIRSGAWRVSHRVNDGKLEVLNCIFAGNTLDNMASIPGKHLTFLNIGKTSQYYPAEYVVGESEMGYTRKDIKKFAKEIKDKFVDLHTFTLGQIGGMFILSNSAKANHGFSKYELLTEVKKALETLHQVKDDRPMYIDPELGNSDGFDKRFDNFVENLDRNGYTTSASNRKLYIDKERLLKIPSNKRYKKENPLRYLTNKFIDVSQERTAIGKIARDVFGFEVQGYKIS